MTRERAFSVMMTEIQIRYRAAISRCNSVCTRSRTSSYSRVSLWRNKPHGRIPGTVVAIEQPALVRRVGQQDPGPTAQRAGKVRDAGVHRDHQIEAADQGRRVAEVGEIGSQVDDIGSLAQRGLVVGPRFLLQADEGRVEPSKRRRNRRNGIDRL